LFAGEQFARPRRWNGPSRLEMEAVPGPLLPDFDNLATTLRDWGVTGRGLRQCARSQIVVIEQRQG
jgi:hypothetical protein